MKYGPYNLLKLISNLQSDREELEKKFPRVEIDAVLRKYDMLIKELAGLKESLEVRGVK